MIYLVIGIVLKNHTKIGTVQFKDHDTKFIFFYVIPLGGLAFYLVSNLVYCLIMSVSSLIFLDSLRRGNFFPLPDLPEYPKDTDY